MPWGRHRARTELIFRLGGAAARIGVFPGGEVDVNAVTSGSGFPTNTTSTVKGGITILKPLDVDIQTARIDGGITLTGPLASGFFATICGNQVEGESEEHSTDNDPGDREAEGREREKREPMSLSLSNVTGGVQIGGGPVVEIPAISCGGNNFDGSVSLTNSIVYMGGNTIHGDLLCSSSTVHVLAPNTITGKNTCY